MDANGNPLATDQRDVPFARISNGRVDLGACEANQTFVVSDTLDEADGNYSAGHLSLREAVQLANLDPGADTITFDPNVFNGDQTITLTAGQLELTNAVSILGPANGVTISGSNQSRVFLIDGGVTANLTNLTITGGNAGVNSGGGIYNGGTLTLVDSTLSSNTGADGGGLINFATATLTDCTVSNNTASPGYGGGIDNDGTLTLVESTLSSNTGADGGGLINFTTATLTDCTVSNNTASPGGGGGVFSEGTLTLANTIVADNVNGSGSPDDIAGMVSAHFSLIGSTSNTIFSQSSGNNITDANPLLAPLGDYGGPTQTMPLLPDSPAIDHGSNALAVAANGKLLTDQRGTLFARITNGTVDIGADEANQTFVVSDTTDESDGNYSAGHLSLREAVQLANRDPGADAIAFDPTVFKADPTITLSGGQLELSGTATILGPANGVTISGNNPSRVFSIDGGVTANLTNLTINGGNAGNTGGGWPIQWRRPDADQLQRDQQLCRRRRRPAQCRHGDADQLQRDQQYGRRRCRPAQFRHGGADRLHGGRELGQRGRRHLQRRHPDADQLHCGRQYRRHQSRQHRQRWRHRQRRQPGDPGQHHRGRQRQRQQQHHHDSRRYPGYGAGPLLPDRQHHRHHFQRGIGQQYHRSRSAAGAAGQLRRSDPDHAAAARFTRRRPRLGRAGHRRQRQAPNHGRARRTLRPRRQRHRGHRRR